MIPPNQQEIIAEMHSQWLEQPITQMMLKCLNKHKQSFANTMSANASAATTPDQQFRLWGVSMKNTDAVIKILTDFGTFQSLLK